MFGWLFRREFVAGTARWGNDDRVVVSPVLPLLTGDRCRRNECVGIRGVVPLVEKWRRPLSCRGLVYVLAWGVREHGASGGEHDRFCIVLVGSGQCVGERWRRSGGQGWRGGRRRRNCRRRRAGLATFSEIGRAHV